MKYMVMECNVSYAVVLDEQGRFLKVANMHYQVGQIVTNVVEIQAPKQQIIQNRKGRWVYSLAAMAACLLLVVVSVIHMRQVTTYASVYMNINPEVRIDVNHKDVVVGVQGLNEDGEQLLEDYSYKKKALDLVMDELVDRAIEMGYLHAGGQITLTLDAKDNEWVVTTSNTLSTHLNEYLTEKMSVTIQVQDKNAETEYEEIVIPVGPEDNTPESTYGESDYGEITPTQDTAGTQAPSDSGYGDSGYDTTDSPYDDGQSSYEEPVDDGQSDYEEPADDGQSSYEEPADGGQSSYEEPADGGQSNYEAPEDDGQSDYEEPADDGQSDYEASDDEGGSDYDDD